MVKTGQVGLIAKRNGINYRTALDWWHQAIDRQEDTGALGSWSLEDIEAELEVLRTLRPGRKQCIGDLTPHCPFKKGERLLNASHWCTNG